MRPDGTTAARIVADPRFARRVARLHAMGVRAVAELLAELLAIPLDRLTIEERLDAFLALSDAALDAASGRDLPPAPLHEVLWR